MRKSEKALADEADEALVYEAAKAVQDSAFKQRCDVSRPVGVADASSGRLPALVAAGQKIKGVKVELAGGLVFVHFPASELPPLG